MPFLLLVFLALVCLPEPDQDWPKPPWGSAPGIAVLLTVLTVIIASLSAQLLSYRVRLVLSPSARFRDLVLERYERDRSRHQYLVFGLYLLVLLVFGWGNAVGRFWRIGDRLLPFAELVILAPFFISLLLSWSSFFDAERSLWSARHMDDGIENALARHEDGGATAATFTDMPPQTIRLPDSLASRWGYLLFQARQKLALVSVPLGLLLIRKELGRQLPTGAGTRWEDVVIQILDFAAVLGAFALMPVIIRIVLGLTPLPDGPLVRRLLDTAKRLGFRCSGLLLWNTRRGMANAMVVGILPWPRYVIFTDRLLEEFTPAEVEAVLGHEIGHIRHRHILFYLGFLLASIMVLVLAAGKFVPAPPAVAANESTPALEAEATAAPTGSESSWAAFFTLHNHPYLKALPLVSAMVAYLFIVFGFVSRRCERQADVFGCRTVSCPRSDCWGHEDGVATGEGGHLCPTGIGTFIQALEKVAIVNGLDREHPGFLQSWQHSTIAKRVAFLHQVMHEPSAEKKFQRRVLLLKCGLLLVLGLGMAALLLI